MIGLSEALFAIGVAVVTIVPRTASSSDCIGGDLAAPFRKSVLIFTIMNVFRNTCFEDRRFRDVAAIESDSINSHSLSEEAIATTFYYVLTSIESFGTSFLMLLMPYLLQCRLQDVINIYPGRDLTPWLLLVLLLQVAGTIGARHNPNLWAIKRFGDAVGCIPVVKTLSVFRRVFSSQRGDNMTIMTLQTIECYSFAITTLAAGAYLFDDHHSTLSQALRVGSIFVSHTRVIFHALLLNVMDDANYIAPPPPPPSETFVEEVDVPTVTTVVECRKLLKV